MVVRRLQCVMAGVRSRKVFSYITIIHGFGWIEKDFMGEADPLNLYARRKTSSHTIASGKRNWYTVVMKVYPKGKEPRR